MTFDEYLADVKRTIPATMTKQDMLINAALGLSAEGGEFANALKKHLYQGHDFDEEDAFEEGGDTLFYVALLCLALGKTFSEMVKHNVAKRLDRYPNGFDPLRSIHRKA